MSKAIYLDIDGVLNDHSILSNGCCTIQYDKVQHFNLIMRECPEVIVFISSAWRYMILLNQMTVQGFEHMLCAFGLEVRGRVKGCTPLESNADDCRGKAISKHAQENGITQFVALDDLELPIPQLVQTSPREGLTRSHALAVIVRLKEAAND